MNLCECMAEVFEVDPAEIKLSTMLDEYPWDSLAIVSTIALVDENFNVMLDGESLVACKSVSDIEGLINSLKSA